MKNYLKIFLIYLLRVVLRPLHFFPLKQNRILFCSFNGKSYNCSPKYVFEMLYSKYGSNLEYVWCIDKKNYIPDKYKCVSVKYLSISHIFYLLTSKVLISNQPIEPFLPKRKSQLFINTTHGGGAYKKGGVQASNLSKSLKFSMREMKYIRSKMIDNVLSSCQIYTEVFSSEIEYNISRDRFLPFGLPRNDIFFMEGLEVIRKKVCDSLGIVEESFLVIYAPTYRGHYNHVDNIDLGLDSQRLIKCVHEKFKKEVVLLFRHHVAAGNMNIFGENIIDVSEYQDMQELLVASDMFITDYSSCLWDFSLSFKPGFLYVPDLKKYQHETDFHIPIDLWPFPYSLTMDELCDQIKSYNKAEAVNKINKHHQHLGSYEKGDSTSRTVDFIMNHFKVINRK